MKILLVVPEFPPDFIGGGGVVYENLYNQYAQAHQVKVLSGLWKKHNRVQQNVEMPASKIDIIRHKLLYNPGDRAYLRSVLPLTIPSTISRWRILHENHFDVAHLHGYGYLSVDETAWMLHQNKIPYVFTSHGMPVSPQTMGQFGSLSYRIYKNYVASRTIAQASSITAISHAASDIPGNRQVQVIHNGATPLPPPNEVDMEWAESILGTSDPRRTVLAAGRLVHSKGFDLLLSALSMITDTWDKLVILGEDGGERIPLLQQAESLGLEERVCIPGRVSRSQLSALLSKIKLLVVPSRTEPFGLIALEGLMSGSTTIVSNRDGLKEIFSDLPEWRVNPFDTATFASALKQELLSPLRDPTLESRIQLTLQRFSWTQVAKQYINLMESVIESR